MPIPVTPSRRWLAIACTIALAAVQLPAQQTRSPRLAATTPPVLSQRAKLEKIIHQKVLANGLEVIVVENHGVPLATVEIDVRNGSFTQTHEYEGLAHLYEHMFFKSNKDYPEPEVVLGEYDRQESSPFFRLNELMCKHLWTTEWSRKNKIGDRDIVRSTTPEKMRYIQHLYYIPNNAALIVAGDVSPDTVFRLAQSTFGDIPRGADPFAANPIPEVPPLKGNDAVI